MVTKTSLALMFALTSQNLSLPPGLLSALCYVESHHKVRAINKSDGKSGTPSYGVCQIKYESAAHMGYVGSRKELRLPGNNIHYAGKYLKYQLDRYNGDIRKAVAAYNAGAYRENKRGLTKNRKYVRKVFDAWAMDK